MKIKYVNNLTQSNTYFQPFCRLHQAFSMWSKMVDRATKKEQQIMLYFFLHFGTSNLALNDYFSVWIMHENILWWCTAIECKFLLFSMFVIFCHFHFDAN